MAFGNVDTTGTTHLLPAGFSIINTNFDDLESALANKGASMVKIETIADLGAAAHIQAALEELKSQVDSKAPTFLGGGTDTDWLIQSNGVWIDPATFGGLGNVDSVNTITPIGGDVTLNADDIAGTWTGNIAAIEVQAAIQELEDEKQPNLPSNSGGANDYVLTATTADVLEWKASSTGSVDSVNGISPVAGDVTIEADNIDIVNSGGIFTATNIEDTLIELEARNNGTRTNNTFSLAGSQITLTSLNIALTISTNLTASANPLFINTSIPGGIKVGDRLYLYNNSSKTLTLNENIQADLYLWESESGYATFTLEAWKVYQFYWDGWGFWTLDWKHILDKKQQETLVRIGERSDAQTIATTTDTVNLTELNLHINVTTAITSAATTFFDATNLLGGVQEGDIIHMLVTGSIPSFQLTLDQNITTDVYLGSIETGNDTYTFERNYVYTFNYVSGLWRLSKKHSNEARIEVLESDTGALSGSSIIEYEFVSVTQVLPTNSGAVRIHAFSDCFIEFGDSSVIASGLTSIYFAAGTEVFGIPSAATHIAVKTAGDIGRINVVGLDTDATEALTDNVVIAYSAGSSSAELPTSAAGNKARIFTMTDCFINFGSSSVTADETSMFFEAGTEIMRVPTGDTHIAVQRYTSDGGLYISGVA